MKKYVQNRCFNGGLISFLIIIFCSSFITKPSMRLNASPLNLSFDSLFPVRWYQKGLESSLSVWQTLTQVFEKNGDVSSVPCNALLGKLSYARFCINHMIHEEVVCIPEDSAYFVMILHKIQDLLAIVVVNEKTHDFVLCASEMIVEMQKQLSEL